MNNSNSPLQNFTPVSASTGLSAAPHCIQSHAAHCSAVYKIVQSVTESRMPLMSGNTDIKKNLKYV